MGRAGFGFGGRQCALSEWGVWTGAATACGVLTVSDRAQVAMGGRRLRHKTQSAQEARWWRWLVFTPV